MLTAERKRILIGTRDMPLRSHVLSGLGHRIGAVHRLHVGVDKAPAQGRVGNLRRAGECCLRLGEDKRCARHGLYAARDRKVHVPARDGASGCSHGVQTRAAQAIQRNAWNGLRQAGEQQSHAGHVAIIFSGLIGTTQEDLVELGPIDAGGDAP